MKSTGIFSSGSYYKLTIYEKSLLVEFTKKLVGSQEEKPGKVLFSGFQPRIDPDLCAGCQTCVDRCPAKAAVLIQDVPEIDTDRCFGCGVCAIGCPVGAIQMIEKPGSPAPPPLNSKELRQAMEPGA